MGKGGIRSSEADEIAGLDEPEMGVYAYPQFEAVIHEFEDDLELTPMSGNGDVSEEPVPVG